MVERTLLWTPRAKQRPRAHVVRGRAVTFTPRETVLAERDIADQWDTVPMEGPISVAVEMTDVSIHVVIDPVPEPMNRRLLRGDIDNYAKLVLDALNGRAWLDDRQIAQLFVVKV
jgi:crossover junction endodeoxyribonuclease RusA